MGKVLVFDWMFTRTLASLEDLDLNQACVSVVLSDSILLAIHHRATKAVLFLSVCRSVYKKEIPSVPRLIHRFFPRHFG